MIQPIGSSTFSPRHRARVIRPKTAFTACAAFRFDSPISRSIFIRSLLRTILDWLSGILRRALMEIPVGGSVETVSLARERRGKAWLQGGQRRRAPSSSNCTLRRPKKSLRCQPGRPWKLTVSVGEPVKFVEIPMVDHDGGCPSWPLKLQNYEIPRKLTIITISIPSYNDFRPTLWIWRHHVVCFPEAYLGRHNRKHLGSSRPVTPSVSLAMLPGGCCRRPESRMAIQA